MASTLRNPLSRLFQPVLNGSLPSSVTRSVWQTTSKPLLPILQIQIPRSALPIAAIAGISSTLQGLWESIHESVLRAVPKKKTSHMKKRHRYMNNGNGKLEDVTALNKCAGCGRPKRAHLLCPYCINAIKTWWRGGSKA